MVHALIKTNIRNCEKSIVDIVGEKNVLSFEKEKERTFIKAKVSGSVFKIKLEQIGNNTLVQIEGQINKFLKYFIQGFLFIPLIVWIYLGISTLFTYTNWLLVPNFIPGVEFLFLYLMVSLISIILLYSKDLKKSKNKIRIAVSLQNLYSGIVDKDEFFSPNDYFMNMYSFSFYFIFLVAFAAIIFLGLNVKLGYMTLFVCMYAIGSVLISLFLKHSYSLLKWTIFRLSTTMAASFLIPLSFLLLISFLFCFIQYIEIPSMRAPQEFTRSKKQFVEELNDNFLSFNPSVFKNKYPEKSFLSKIEFQNNILLTKGVALKYMIVYSVLSLIGVSLFLYLVTTFILRIIKKSPEYKHFVSIFNELSYSLMKAGFITVKKDKIFLILGVIILYFITMIYQLIGFFLSVELILYVFTGKLLIYPQISGILASFVAFFMFFGIPAFLGKLFLLILFMPFLLQITFLIIKFASLGYYAIKNRFVKKQDVPEKIKEIVEELSLKAKVKVPKILLVKGVQIGVFIEPGSILEFTPRLIISEAVLKFFTEEELKAIIAHEIAHIKYELKWITFIRYISYLTLTSPGLLVLAFDLRERELRADRFSAELTGSKDAIISALRKLEKFRKASIAIQKKEKETLRGFNEKIRYKIKELWKGLVSAYNITYGKVLLGYVHPSFEERVRYLKEQTEPAQ